MALNPQTARMMAQGITSPRQFAQQRREQEQQNELAKLLLQQQQMSNRGTQLGNTQKAVELSRMMQPKQNTLGDIRELSPGQFGRDVMGPNGKFLETRQLPGYQGSYQKPEKPKALSAAQQASAEWLPQGVQWHQATNAQKQEALRTQGAHKRSEAGLDTAAKAAGAAGMPPTKDNLTPAQLQVDKKFADEFLDWEATGGMGDVEKNLAQLKEVEAMLQGVVNSNDPVKRARMTMEDREKYGDMDLTGDVKAMIPDRMMALYNEDAVDAKEMVQEVVQRNLRLILGAQFTEKEGERLISRAYNDGLDESVNLKRVQRLIKQIGQAAQSKASAANYYKKKGTLNGWSGSLPSLEGIKDDSGLDADLTYNPQTGELE